MFWNLTLAGIRNSVSRHSILAAPWFKLNKDNVCFGAKNDSYGNFTIQRSGAILTLKLVYVSGYVTCHRKNFPYGSHWACNDPYKLGTIVTDASNKVIFPHNYDNRSFTLPGYHPNSSELVFHSLFLPLTIAAGQEFRVWYHEDFRNSGSLELNNAGRTCADVYGLFNRLPQLNV